MRICVIGLGYMGIPTALLLAKAGFSVIGYDIVADKVDKINKGVLPFKEKGLAELFAEAKHNFRAVSRLDKDEMSSVDVFLAAVPTPFKEDKSCDLSYVESAMESLVPFIKKGSLVILESTVSPGSTEKVVKPILEKSGLIAGKDFSLSYVSEKAIPGNTLHEMVHNDRVIGGIDDISVSRARSLYRTFVKGELCLTDCTTAETVKLVENTFRDINIAFANELAVLCENLGLNVWEVIELANRHPRVNVLFPSPGVGGHCIAVDPWFLIQGMDNEKSALTRAARIINDGMPQKVFMKLRDIAKKHGFASPTVAVLGVAYKKNVDDARSAPAEKIIGLCKSEGWNVEIHDPYVRGFSHTINHDISSVLNAADIAVIITDHDFYKDVDFSEKIVLDTRNMGIKSRETVLLGGGTKNA